MFLIELNYQKPLEEVNRYLPVHNDYLEHNYSAGNFLMSGRKEPRNGGVIIANVASQLELEAIYHQDPFYQQQIANYRIIQFYPTKAQPELQKWLEN
ncbi:YciI family protein [Fructilactobacillus cliffordii]|uniref:YciI family protein n=1 Tax=Fructilactobacillus cliffordii TaxID=2940299 RepID=UPI002093F63C|nr:YciI family protein [Fructilactobacillus cliffordii]USS86357.1 YciI family protein [Fructilactobacillus cliffordii]